MIAWAVVVAHNLGLAERRKQALHTVSVRNSGEAADPIVVRMEAAEAVHMVVVHREVEAADPIAVRTEIEVGAVRMAVEAVHTEFAGLDLAVGLDH